MRDDAGRVVATAEMILSRATSDVNNPVSQRAEKKEKKRVSLRRTSCSGMSFKYASG